MKFQYTNKKLLQVRVDPVVIKAADRLSVEWDMWRAEAVERLLGEAIDRYVQPGSRWPWEAP